MFLSKKILLTSVCSCLAVNTVIALPFALFTPSVLAQSRRVRYIPPTNLDAPRTSIAGATRSICTSGDCLIALLPTLKSDNAPVPQTIAERPTIYFLSPKFKGSVEFILYENKAVPDQPYSSVDLPKVNRKKIYAKTFLVNNDAGIIALKMPDECPILEIGKNYTWRFTVKPVPSDSQTHKMVQGNVVRVLPTKKLATQLQTISQPIERAALFAQEGIWYETLQALADAQVTVPTNTEVFNEWNSLLKSAKLDLVLPYSFVSQKQSKEPSQEP